MEIAVGFGIVTSSASLILTAMIYRQNQDIRETQNHARDEMVALQTQVNQLKNPSIAVDVPPEMFPCPGASSKAPEGRDWGPEQATGEPNTPCIGDVVTAWASATPDEQDEWIDLTYGKELTPRHIIVYETYNPGALKKITAINGAKETVLWQGQDPARQSSPNEPALAEISPAADVRTKTIRLYLSSKNVPGWNEIDAVGIRENDDVYHWAISAKASSTYAEPVMLPQERKVF